VYRCGVTGDRCGVTDETGTSCPQMSTSYANLILKKLFESFKAAKDDSPIIEGPHTQLC